MSASSSLVKKHDDLRPRVVGSARTMNESDGWMIPRFSPAGLALAVVTARDLSSLSRFRCCLSMAGMNVWQFTLFSTWVLARSKLLFKEITK